MINKLVLCKQNDYGVISYMSRQDFSGYEKSDKFIPVRSSHSEKSLVHLEVSVGRDNTGRGMYS